MAYYQHHQIENFKSILQKAADEEINKRKEISLEERSQKIALLNAFSSFYHFSAFKISDDEERDRYKTEAVNLINKADQIYMYERLTWIYKGFFLVAKGQLNAAEDYFNNALENEGDNIFALIGKACLFYSKGKFIDALKIYKRVMKLNPLCPPNVRFGIGLCYFKLEKIDKALSAFERVLTMVTLVSLIYRLLMMSMLW